MTFRIYSSRGSSLMTRNPSFLREIHLIGSKRANKSWKNRGCSPAEQLQTTFGQTSPGEKAECLPAFSSSNIIPGLYFKIKTIYRLNFTHHTHNAFSTVAFISFLSFISLLFPVVEYRKKHTNAKITAMMMINILLVFFLINPSLLEFWWWFILY